MPLHVNTRTAVQSADNTNRSATYYSFQMIDDADDERIIDASFHFINEHFEFFSDTHHGAVITGSTYDNNQQRSKRAVDAVALDYLYNQQKIRVGIAVAMSKSINAPSYRNDRNHAKSGLFCCESMVTKVQSHKNVMALGLDSLLAVTAKESKNSSPNQLGSNNSECTLATTVVSPNADKTLTANAVNIGNNMIVVVDCLTKTVKQILPARLYEKPIAKGLQKKPLSLQTWSEPGRISRDHLATTSIFELKPDDIIIHMTEGVWATLSTQCTSVKLPSSLELVNDNVETQSASYLNYQEISLEPASFNQLIQAVLQKEEANQPKFIVPAHVIAYEILSQAINGTMAERKSLLKLVCGLKPYTDFFTKILQYLNRLVALCGELEGYLTRVIDNISSTDKAVIQLSLSKQSLIEKLTWLVAAVAALLGVKRPKHFLEVESLPLAQLDRLINELKDKVIQLPDGKLPANTQPLMDIKNLLSDVKERLEEYRKTVFENYTLQHWLTDIGKTNLELMNSLSQFIGMANHEGIVFNADEVPAYSFVVERLNEIHFGGCATIAVMRVPNLQLELVRALIHQPKNNELVAKINTEFNGKPQVFKNALLRLSEERYSPRVDQALKKSYQDFKAQLQPIHDFVDLLIPLCKVDYEKIKLSVKDVCELFNAFRKYRHWVQHENPQIDQFFGIEITKPLQNVWSSMSQKALVQLFKEVDACPDLQDKLVLLDWAEEQPLFCLHYRNSFFTGAVGKTLSVIAIRDKKAELQPVSICSCNFGMG